MWILRVRTTVPNGSADSGQRGLGSLSNGGGEFLATVGVGHVADDTQPRLCGLHTTGMRTEA
jgi:hypothetical protein